MDNERFHELLVKAASERDSAFMTWLRFFTDARRLHAEAFPGSPETRKDSFDRIVARYGSPSVLYKWIGTDDEAYGGTLIESIKNLDNQMWEITMKSIPFFKKALVFPKIFDKVNIALGKELNNERDDLLVKGFDPESPPVKDAETKIRDWSEKIFGSMDIVTTIENAISGLKTERDTLIKKLGSAGLNAYRSARSARKTTTVFGATPISRAELASGEAVYGADLEGKRPFPRPLVAINKFRKWLVDNDYAPSNVRIHSWFNLVSAENKKVSSEPSIDGYSIFVEDPTNSVYETALEKAQDFDSEVEITAGDDAGEWIFTFRIPQEEAFGRMSLSSHHRIRSRI
jgi:hypothetical protein